MYRFNTHAYLLQEMVSEMVITHQSMDFKVLPCTHAVAVVLLCDVTTFISHCDVGQTTNSYSDVCTIPIGSPLRRLSAAINALYESMHCQCFDIGPCSVHIRGHLGYFWNHLLF